MEQRLEAIHRIFRNWDGDGGGTISRDELQQVMLQLSPMWGPKEISCLMSQIDTSGDGEIDYSEFLAWIANPDATHTLHKDGWLGEFNFRAVVKPLFEVFDKDNSGHICVHEFNELSSILNTSLDMHPRSRNRSETLRRCFNGDYFAELDKDGDRQVSFDEFVKWQTEVIKKSGIPNSMVKDLIEELAAALNVIFHIDEMTQKGEEPSGALQALNERIEEVAARCQLIYADRSLIEKTNEMEKAKLWSKPVPSADAMQRLYRLSAGELGVNLKTGTDQARPASRAGQAGQPFRASARRASRFSARKSPTAEPLVGQVRLCIPDNAQHPPARWLAQVVRKDESGQEEFFIYVAPSSEIDGLGCNWRRLEAGSLPVFNAALAELPAPLRLYSLFFCQTLGKKLSYAAATLAVKMAVEAGLLSDDIASRFSAYVTSTVKTGLGTVTLKELKELGENALEEEVELQLSKATFSPRAILAVLWEIGLPVEQSIWQALDASDS
eukprot:TRINITY_DN42908_c0_g1_i1.p1 TRINITY_DN42908_c0_g1~~TRINITY_DN42908_c0_g1_i1.p1  ORF type:complete len:511 (+),score=109.92 TRINITY_DN42908_c0_g1_i1:45-1535(+)